MQQQHMFWQQCMVRAALMRKEGKGGRKSVKARYTILTKSL